MPWSKTVEDNLDLQNARQVLDTDHYGLIKVKERIIEHLATFKLKRAAQRDRSPEADRPLPADVMSSALAEPATSPRAAPIPAIELVIRESQILLVILGLPGFCGADPWLAGPLCGPVSDSFLP